jgi:hypothetical protein
VSLKFTKFMDGRELREAILRKHSGGGTPYEVEVWYDGDGEMYFRGGWSQFAEDHDLHQGFFMIFDYHCGISKIDVKIYDGTDAGRMTTQLGTPRGRYDENSSKFSLSKKPRFVGPVGKANTSEGDAC